LSRCPLRMTTPRVQQLDSAASMVVLGAEQVSQVDPSGLVVTLTSLSPLPLSPACHDLVCLVGRRQQHCRTTRLAVQGRHQGT